MLTIQILHYDFLGPVPLSEWGPPMEEVVYLVLSRTKDTFKIIFAGQCQKTDNAGFFIKNEKFKCWASEAGSENNIYLAIYPMWQSSEEERENIVNKIITKYEPKCNAES